jgi:uncharacterized protein (TIGR02246 family)
MKPHHLRLLIFSALAFGLSTGTSWAQPRAGNPEGEAGIQKNAEAFVEAFHKGDSKALAARWTADGDYTDQDGRQFKGRDAIEKLFAGMFAANKGLKVRIDSVSLRFLDPDAAVEDGTTEVFAADGGPFGRARFTIVHVKKDGQWLFGSVRDAPFVPPSNYNHLRGFDMLAGDWIGTGEKGEVERLTVTWTETRNFLNATFSTTVKDLSVGHATHWIGWDPLEKRVRSWIFDASGAFGDGAWTQDGKKWTVKTTAVLQDGKKAAATYVLALVDADTISLESRDRSVDGSAIPGSRLTTLKRTK